MNKELFTEGLKILGGTVSEEQLDMLEIYSEMLKERNKVMNLTAITDDDGISIKHFLDSILPLYGISVPKGAHLADVGTGAGFPGIPIKIMRPDISVTLIDSLQKRIGFLNDVRSRLKLSDIECIHGRAEDLGRDKKYRECFDIVASRAVANLKVLCEYCLPFVNIGGRFVALKSENCAEELEEARAMIGSIGGKIEDVLSIPLPKSDITRRLIVIRKIKNTPPQFPRRPNKIK